MCYFEYYSRFGYLSFEAHVAIFLNYEAYLAILSRAAYVANICSKACVAPRSTEAFVACMNIYTSVSPVIFKPCGYYQC